MAKLTSSVRRALPTSAFALPDRRYPIHDRSHAINAKARATQELKEGNLTAQQYRMIVKKANKKLASIASFKRTTNKRPITKIGAVKKK